MYKYVLVRFACKRCGWWCEVVCKSTVVSTVLVVLVRCCTPTTRSKYVQHCTSTRTVSTYRYSTVGYAYVNQRRGSREPPTCTFQTSPSSSCWCPYRCCFHPSLLSPSLSCLSCTKPAWPWRWWRQQEWMKTTRMCATTRWWRWWLWTKMIPAVVL